ncbi:MAG: hypothetical protein U9N34_05235 [Candidatus Cloacimonadota bacterium]|nr:hypothetical protein [Candidatus Cloacimonadota bacterium]
MKEFEDKLKERYENRKRKSYFKWSNFIIKFVVFVMILLFIKDFISNNTTGMFDFFLNDSKEINETRGE